MVLAHSVDVCPLKQPPTAHTHLALRSLVFKPWYRRALCSAPSALRGSMLFSLKTNTVLLQEKKSVFRTSLILVVYFIPVKYINNI